MAGSRREDYVEELNKTVNDVSRLRKNLTGYIISGEAHRVLVDIASRVEGLALAIPRHTELLLGLSRRLKLLSTLAQALHNQWKHVHSKRALGKVNYLDQHLGEIERTLREIHEMLRTGVVADVREIQVIRRIMF